MKKYLFLLLAAFWMLPQHAFLQESGFKMKFRFKVPENKSEKGSSAHSGSSSPSGTARPAETIFLTLHVSSDLDGILSSGEKSYPLTANGEAVKIPLYRDKGELIFEGQNGFTKRIKEEFAPSQRGSTLERALSLREDYRVFLQQEANKSSIERTLDGIFRQMVAITGSEDGIRMKSFEISRYEVTVGQFAAFAAQSGKASSAEYITDSSYVILPGSPRERDFVQGICWKHDPLGRIRQEDAFDHPVVNISWYEAVAFCDWLSKQNELYDYRLPTVAEWEYAAGCGDYSFTFPWGESLEVDKLPDNTADISLKVAVPQRKEEVSEISDGFPFTSPVGSFAPNCFGLYDMGGNVAEWTSDDRSRKRSDNSYAAEKVIKGGSYWLPPSKCKVMDQKGCNPKWKHAGIGFRVVRVPKSK